MKSLHMIGLMAMLTFAFQTAEAQTTYVFSGAGNWNNAALWSPGLPPNPLPAGDVIFISGDCIMNVTRRVLAGASLTINDGASLSINTNRSLRVDGLMDSGGTLTVNGTMNLYGGPFNNAGNVVINSVFYIRNGGTMTNSFSTVISSGGTFFVYDDLINTGLIDNQAGGAIRLGNGVGDLLTNNGTLINNGNFTWNNGLFINSLTSTYSGSGTLTIIPANAIFTPEGELNPGTSPGTMTIIGNASIAGTLNMELASASSFDVLNVSGNLNLTLAQLKVTLLGSFNPPPPSQFTIINAGALTGTGMFSSAMLPGNPGAMTVLYNIPATGNVTLNVGSALPVTWLSFRAALDGEDIKLSWSTASESNNEGFDVQRSENGRDWQTIAFVEGAGTTSEVTNYSYTDPTLSTLNSQLAYYRLQQRDYDGTTDFSPVRVVELGTTGGIRVFPNPADEAVTVAFADPLEKRGSIQLFNQNGRLVAEETLAPGTSEHTIRVAYLPAGTYVLRVVAGAQVWMQRVVVE